MFAAAAEQEQQQLRNITAFSPSESSLKQRMVTAYAPSEKIELYSPVCQITFPITRETHAIYPIKHSILTQLIWF